MEAGELRKIIYLSRYGMPGESTVPNQVFFLSWRIHTNGQFHSYCSHLTVYLLTWNRDALKKNLGRSARHADQVPPWVRYEHEKLLARNCDKMKGRESLYTFVLWPPYAYCGM